MVAEKIIRELENERNGGLTANGAYRLRDAMSQEARTILAERVEEMGFDPEQVEFTDTFSVAEYHALKDAFIRLGLDLEGEGQS